MVHAAVEEVTGGPRFACTLLHVAAAHNDVAAIELLLRHGADINARAPELYHGPTPVFLTLVRGITPTPTLAASSDGCRDAFEALLEAGANLSLRSHCHFGHVKVDCTPLGYALACHGVVQRGNALGRASQADGSWQIERLQELGAPE